MSILDYLQSVFYNLPTSDSKELIEARNYRPTPITFQADFNVITPNIYNIRTSATGLYAESMKK